MLKSVFFKVILVLTVFFLISSCRGEFERVRLSGDPQRIYEAANRYYDEGEYTRAKTLYELILNSYRGRAEAEQLFFRFAYTHYYLRQYILASFYFDNFANTFPNSPNRQEADFMAAYSNYLLSPSFRLDQEYTVKAIDAFQRYVNRYPTSERVAEINDFMDELRRKLERKAFYQADLYFRMGAYQSAIASFEHLLQDYPETQDIERVRYLIVKSNFRLAENSILARQAERYGNTMTAYRRFERRHGNSQYINELREYYAISEQKVNELTNE
ncbi:MAG: outer membrane protein assembly factor BamD [Saprospirales bacterium]|nr:MAG: outer membrane protein assembly factor BamD [Saprospirales bacterium]